MSEEQASLAEGRVCREVHFLLPLEVLSSCTAVRVYGGLAGAQRVPSGVLLGDGFVSPCLISRGMQSSASVGSGSWLKENAEPWSPSVADPLCFGIWGRELCLPWWRRGREGVLAAFGS